MSTPTTPPARLREADEQVDFPPLPPQDFLVPSLWKFIIRSDPESEADEMFFPAVALVVAYNEAHALSLLLAYCKDAGLVRCRDWEWLFHCDVVQLPLHDPQTCVFVAL